MARLEAAEQATMFGCSIGQLPQILGGTQEAGFRVILWRTSLLPFVVREVGPGRETRRQFGQSQASEMGLNPSFFKAGAGGGEV